ncbi:MAG TPA: hypothetical protein VGO34_11530 [Alphaproteobacteria bacterium]|jgi:chemotaxis response regulator CheB
MDMSCAAARKITSQRPIPVVMCSTLTEEGSETLLDAMEAGAIDVICKPRVDTKHFLTESRVRICDAIKGAAHARLGTRSAAPKRRTVEAKLTADIIMPAPASRQAIDAQLVERLLAGCSLNEVRRQFEQWLCDGKPPASVSASSNASQDAGSIELF